MRALLLAAGFGKRLLPLTQEIPKCLVTINKIPLLEYWLEILIQGGITEILINLHYLPEKVREFVQQSKYKRYITMVYEEKLVGTGGTLLKNRDFFCGDSVMLIHADNLSLFNISEFIDAHKNRPTGAEITMMTFTTSTPESCGIVQVNDKGIVLAFYEKIKNPPGNIANGAVFIIEPLVIEFLDSFYKEEIDFSKEVIPHYVGRIATYHNNLYHRDIGTLESLQIAELDFPEVYKKYNK